MDVCLGARRARLPPPVTVPVDVGRPREAQLRALRRSLGDTGRWVELERRFDAAVKLQDFDLQDVEGARRYVGAYVDFIDYAEGRSSDDARRRA